MHILGLILDNKYKPNLSSEYQNFAQARFQLANFGVNRNKPNATQCKVNLQKFKSVCFMEAYKHVKWEKILDKTSLVF